MRKTFFIAFGIVFGLTASGVVLASRNSSGTYSLPAGNPVVSGTTITTTWANGTLSDLSTEVTDSLSRSGKGSMLAPVKTPDGTVAAPAFTFTNEPGTGLYRAAAGDARVSVLGVDRLRMNSTNALDVLSSGTSLFTLPAAGSALLKGTVADGASAVGVVLDTTNALSTSGAKIASFRTGGSEKTYIDRYGAIVWTSSPIHISTVATNGTLNIQGNKDATESTAPDIAIGAYATRTAGELLGVYHNALSTKVLGIDYRGYEKLYGSNPSSSTGFTNTLTPSNIIKAWGYLTCGAAGAVTVTNGFNVASASYSGTNISVTLTTGLSATNAGAVSGTVPGPTGYYFDGVMTSATNLNIQAWWSTSSRTWANGDRVTFMVVGLQ